MLNSSSTSRVLHQLTQIHDHTLTYKSQSTANIGPILSMGSPTASNTITKLLSPGLGIPAAPIDTTVQISLKFKMPYNEQITHESNDIGAAVNNKTREYVHLVG